MSDIQILLGVIVLLLVLLIAAAGWRVKTKQRVDDTIYEGLTQDADRLMTLVGRLRTQLDEEIATRHANEQRLRSDLSEAEALIARFRVEVDLLRTQVTGLGAVPVA